MTNGLLDQLLDSTESDVFTDATIRTRFDTAAVRITETSPEPPESPAPELSEGEVELRPDSGESQIFDGETPVTNALSAASSSDSIFIGPGEFDVGSLTVEIDDVEIRPDSSDETTTIVGQIVVTSANVSLTGLTLIPGTTWDTVLKIETSVTGISINRCSFVIDTEIKNVIDVLNGSTITVSGCTFETDGDVTITRYIFVHGDAEDVRIEGCTFSGKAEKQVILLRADGSQIVDCNFEDIIKINVEFELIKIDARNIDISGCIFLISRQSLEQAILIVEGSKNIDIDECEFGTDEDVSIERFILVESGVINANVTLCIFTGTVEIVVIVHNGTGEIDDCKFEGITIDNENGNKSFIEGGEGVEIINIDVTVVEVSLQSGVEVFRDLGEAIDAASEDDKIVVGPGEYDGGQFIGYDLAGLELVGPNVGTSGASEERDPGDETTEAIINGGFGIGPDDVRIEGFTLVAEEFSVVGTDSQNATGIELTNNIIRANDATGDISGLNLFGVNDILIEGNLIESVEAAISAELSEYDYAEDTFEISNNTIRDTRDGVDLEIDFGQDFTQPANSSNRGVDDVFVPIIENTFLGNDTAIEVEISEGTVPDLTNTLLEENNTFEDNGTNVEISSQVTVEVVNQASKQVEITTIEFGNELTISPESEIAAGDSFETTRKVPASVAEATISAEFAPDSLGPTPDPTSIEATRDIPPNGTLEISISGE
jgi:hypothetical protein